MAEGSMRCDCNVSVRPKGEEALGTRTELKNINSFRFIERAIDTEVARQIDLIEEGGRVVQETRLYDPDRNETRSMRSKEEANDYRYFPCPDLLPVVIDEDYIETLRQTLPELPDARRERFIRQYALSEYDAGVLSAYRAQADYYEQVVEQCGDAKLAANWVMGELAKFLNQHDLSIEHSPIRAQQLGELLQRIQDNTLSGNIAKKVFELMWSRGGSADEIIEAEGLKQVTDTAAIEKIVAEVIARAEKQVAQYKAAEPDKRNKLLGFFMGQVMKATGGKANPGVVTTILKQQLDALCD
jgi:aspartyl-tRNA(Asn)/glutamyl-tRNA(Gln) amidotransferase subunit B